uniref:Uncharacterized protein n=1 Tax=Arundo donax TaxID=35708 RepID=A0A0A9DAI9_ARUDO
MHETCYHTKQAQVKELVQGEAPSSVTTVAWPS